MSTQNEKLKTEFEQWKGVEKQLDDICIIGVKI